MSTVKDALNHANPNDQHNMWNRVSPGDILAGLVPRLTARTGLTNQATHVHNLAGVITQVTDGSDTPLAIVLAGAAGAGEVLVVYDANGLATLTFNGALTAYKVMQTVLPATLGAILASESGASH